MHGGLVLREDIVMTASGAQELGPDLKMLLIGVSVCIGLLCVLGLPLLGCCCPSRDRTIEAGGVWEARGEVVSKICGDPNDDRAYNGHHGCGGGGCGGCGGG